MVNRPGREDRRSKSGYKFDYKLPSTETVKRMATTKGGSRFDSILKSGYDLWRAKTGDNLIRILPPTWDNPEHFGYEVFIHRNIGPDNSTYLCPRLTRDAKTGEKMNKACACCDGAKEAKDNGDQDEYKSLNAGTGYVCWIIDRDDRDIQAVPALLSFTQNHEIMAMAYNERSGKVIYPAHHEEGSDIHCKRSGTGLKTKYIWSIDRDEGPIFDNDDDMEEVLEFIKEHPIPDILEFKSNDYLTKLLNGGDNERDEDLDDDKDDEREERSGRRSGRDDDARSSRRERDDDGDSDEKEERYSRRNRDRNNSEEEEARESQRNRRNRADDGKGDEGEEKPRSRGRGRGRDDDKDERSNRRQTRDDNEDGEPDENDAGNSDEGEAREERSSRRGRDRDRERERSEDEERPRGGGRNREREEDAERPRGRSATTRNRLNDREEPRSRRNRDDNKRDAEEPRRRARR